MITTLLRVMLLALVRDRGALAMGFVVPAAFFLIFASIYPSTSSEQLGIDAAIADTVNSQRSRALVEALLAPGDLHALTTDIPGADGVRGQVRTGTADVGLVIGESASGDGRLVYTVVSDPARQVALQLLLGRLQRAHASTVISHLDVDLVRLSEVLSEAALESIAALADGAPVRVEAVAGQVGSRGQIAYYAGAVAVLFLLFSCVHGAISLIEEQESGVLDRILTGAGGAAALVNGKFAFLCIQGFVQTGVIFVVAWMVHGVDLPGHLAAWALTTIVASATGAALALALVSGCRSRRQAQTLANVVILVLSALGGSMVPRYLMPSLLQDLGWFTPNAWALEAYTRIFWRELPMSELAVPLAVLLVAAGGLLALAHRLFRRQITIA